MFTVAFALGAALVLRLLYCASRPVARCRRCAARLGRVGRRRALLGVTCFECRGREDRERRDAHAQAQMAVARARFDREYAQAEASRVASRFPLLRAGTFGRVGSAFVLDGWVFADPRALADAGAVTSTLPQQLTLGRWALVYGWRLHELHAEAHGTACSCL